VDWHPLTSLRIMRARNNLILAVAPSQYLRRSKRFEMQPPPWCARPCVVVVDARHPLLHIPPALYAHVARRLRKPLVLVLNKVGRCRLKPAETRVESAFGLSMGEAPYGPSFPHSHKWGRPPMHRLVLESTM